MLPDVPMGITVIEGDDAEVLAAAEVSVLSSGELLPCISVFTKQFMVYLIDR